MNVSLSCTRSHRQPRSTTAASNWSRPAPRDEQLRWEFCWSFALLPLPRGRCRLLVRERTAFGHPLTWAMFSPIGLISFVMTREMLRGIKRRVEAVAPDQGAPVES